MAGWTLAAAMALTALPVLSQQEEGPILRPKKQTAQPAEATLLVLCDLACDWKLDGEAKGRIDARGSAKAKIELGQHLVNAATPDGLDKVEKELEIKVAGQTLVRLELTTVRDARLQAEQAARLQDLRDHAVERNRAGWALYDQKRYDEARPLLQQACDGGSMLGCNNLGVLYEKGYGVSRDYAQARALYRKACDGGIMYGCNNLGVFYEKGYGVSQDYAQARAFYRKACDEGSMYGCSNLGFLFQNGQGGSLDYAQARALLQQACDGGNMLGCRNLGVLYEDGQGVSQDYTQARSLYQRACDGGEMLGCRNLGVLYETGQGLKSDKVQARTLYQKACDGGDQVACDNLKNLH
jgi:TPR repeat protein